MGFDLLVRDARLPEPGRGGATVDIGFSGGRFAAVAPRLAEEAGEVVEAGGRLVSPGCVETHIHLDKSRILDRCAREESRARPRPMERVAAAKRDFTVEDVAERAARTLEGCILHGTTLMRPHAEVAPKAGLRGFEGVRSLAARCAWAVDIEVCAMAQEGLTGDPGTDAQIRRVFELVRRYDFHVDLHLDAGDTAERLDPLLVCELAERQGCEGRAATGHATELAAPPPGRLRKVAARLRGAGVAVTVPLLTGLCIGGRDRAWDVKRGVAGANALAAHGVACSISSNNILIPFTPMGDGDPARQANLCADVAQRASPGELEADWSMVTADGTRLMRRREHGIAPGKPTDFVLVDAPGAVDAPREIAPTRGAPVLHRP